MYKARKNIEVKGVKRDLIEEYANFGSAVYAPITRDGLSLDKKANKYEVQPEALSTYQGLQELSRTLPTSIFQNRVSVNQVKFDFKKGLNKKENQHILALKKAQLTIDKTIKQQEIKNNLEEEDNLLSKVKVRPKTPPYRDIQRTENLDELKRNDKKYLAITLLQRLMRGRAKQNMMFEGQEKRLDLIAELRATEEWKSSSENQEEKALIEKYQERVLDGAAEALQSEVISRTMDHLSKELVRFK